MHRLSDLIGLDASRLTRPRKLMVGLAILCLAPALLMSEWASVALPTGL